MNNSILLFVFLYGTVCFAQNITNTLAPGGKFIVKDGANDYLTLEQATGKASLLRSLVLGNTIDSNSGVIFKGTERFIHNYGAGNTFIGINSGNFNTEGLWNTATGYYSLYLNTTGSQNTAYGIGTLNHNTSGSYNTANGAYALNWNSTGSLNTADGNSSLAHNTSGNANTATGFSALSYNTTGNQNIAIGAASLYDNTTGNNNIAIGFGALYFNNANSRSTAIGFESMYNADSRTIGRETFNTAVGYESLRGGEGSVGNIGIYNTAIGGRTLLSNTAGSENTANGYQSLVINNTGSQNTADGAYSLFSNTTGTFNTAIGMNALYSNTTEYFNTALGYSAYPTVSTTNYTGIGYFVGGNSSTSNRVEIGNTSVTWIGGQVGWSIYSDERIKENISDNVPGLAFITKLRPVTYSLNIHKQNEIMYKGKENQGEWDSKYDIEKIRMTGFLAQEVEKAAQDINYNFSGVEKSKNEDGLYSLRYSEFVMPLVKAVQEQQIQLQNQYAQIQNQERIIAELTKRIEALERK